MALSRGIARDAATEGTEEAERIHRHRYHAAEEIYVREVDPKAKAPMIIDNTDFLNPAVVRW